MSNTRLYIVGVSGRMGRTITSVANEYDLTVVGGTGIVSDGELFDFPVHDPEANMAPGEIADDCGGIDVIIDFSGPEGFRAATVIAKSLGIPVVSGSTGLDDDDFVALEALGQDIPVLWGSNMSLGVNLLTTILPAITDALGDKYDVEIVDIHHNKKKDAPSGTAITLADAVQASETRRGDSRIYGREGFTGERQTNEIGIHALRAGDIVGDHTVYFCGPGERLEFVHRAHSRETFARGALRAAAFLIQQSPGAYTMKNVLGL